MLHSRSLHKFWELIRVDCVLHPQRSISAEGKTARIYEFSCSLRIIATFLQQQDMFLEVRHCSEV